jgi:regulatory protein
VSSTGLDWKVALAKRGGTSFSAGKPKGSVHVETTERGRETISVPARVAKLLDAKQKAGELEPESRAELMYEVKRVSLASAKRRLAELVDKRDYASHEAARKLRLDGYGSQVTSEAVAWAEDAGLIDNGRFADVFIRTKLAAGWGQRRIERELGERGISCEDVEGWPYEYLDPDDELSRAIEVAGRKRVTGANQTQKMARFLVGRGFSASVAFDAARRVLEDEE